MKRNHMKQSPKPASLELDHAACYRAACQRDVRFDGRFFTGVKTTGIYCRPICPARTPLSKNVTFFPTAAAAQEAGFRPCLRCRPETAPDLGAWRGTSNTVSRALSLIEHGALDDSEVDALAERLGVGERQLRRLFQQHLGASPVAVAQTRRVLLAKQLIHETYLPMTEVAFAAGFGSIRRFNETFRQLFGRSPRQLRRTSGPEFSAAAAGELTLLLRYQPPYDWDAIIAFLRQRAIAGIEHVGARCYARTLQLDGLTGTVTVEPADGNALRATVRFPKLSALPAIIARLRRVFDLGADPLAIAAHLAEDPTLAPLVKARPGLRVPGAWDGFELAIRAVLGQQITVVAAARLAGRMVAAYGEPLLAPGDCLTHVFPRPDVIAGADLASLGMPRSRAAALSAVAAAAVADPHVFDANCGLEDAVKRLRAIPRRSFSTAPTPGGHGVPMRHNICGRWLKPQS
jgi:AraC family transcriptional regulator, regulatory protein of adaptative response / DNA-3-methyladenine glycosylase II